jgi:hypothetical protein
MKEVVNCPVRLKFELPVALLFVLAPIFSLNKSTSTMNLFFVFFLLFNGHRSPTPSNITQSNMINIK